MLAKSDTPYVLPPKGLMVKSVPKIGQTYYAVRYLALGSWTKVNLKNVVTSGNIVNGKAVVENMFEVHACDIKQQEQGNRFVSGRELAYGDPCPVQLEVGMRVIAIFNNEAAHDPKKGKKDLFYPGIVAEPLAPSNGHR